ncbi:hypothetical protein K7432_009735 [Basidiobolus ranarum]|uniref:SMP-30/Gluconolactonase/LRE-like region domain-containing protein n=1 Tax=Basidiobolus ranarum TaxID=34480 RepID=A0ABR2WPZ1_9FUNG
MRGLNSLWISLAITASAVVAQSNSNSKVVEIGPDYNVLSEPFSREVDEPFSKTKSGSKTFENIGEAAFIVYNKRFYDIIGTQPNLTVVAEKDFSFAHEAGIYVEKTNEIMFTSNRLGDTSGTDQYADVYKMSVDTFEVTKISPSIDINLANGGTFYDGKAIIVGQGKGSLGAAIYSVDPVTYETKVILNNFFGLKFNSLNDVAVSRKDGSFWFTDPSYGFEQKFRQQPQLGDFVYRWDPKTGDVRLVADGFVKPNGFQFSPDENIAYVSDTGFTTGVGQTDVKRPHTVYAFDVSRKSGGSVFLTNRRVFALSDTGIPDGIKLDIKGNLYIGSGDGVNVYAPDGTLLGKINTIKCANLVFAKDDLFILSENKIYHTKLNTQGVMLN